MSRTVSSGTTSASHPLEPASGAKWRSIPLHPMKAASKITGLSPASLYVAAHRGQLRLVRLSGRTLVPVDSLISFVESAQDWTPSARNAEAVAQRVLRSHVGRGAAE